jgi:hypothetical protein
MVSRRSSYVVIVLAIGGAAALLVRLRKRAQPGYLANLFRQAHHLLGRYRV